MWEPQPLTALKASKACRGENFNLTLMTETKVTIMEIRALGNVHTSEPLHGWSLPKAKPPCDEHLEQ
jgi:hypothetical protein